MDVFELTVAHDFDDTRACATLSFWKESALGPRGSSQVAPRIDLTVLTPVDTHPWTGDSQTWISVVSDIFSNLPANSFSSIGIRISRTRCSSCIQGPEENLPALDIGRLVKLFDLPVFGRASLYFDDSGYRVWLHRKVYIPV